MIEVAAFMSTMNFFASAEMSATASALGVSAKHASMSTWSRTTSSCASRLATSGRDAAGILADEFDFFAGNGVAMLLHIELHAIVHLGGGVGKTGLRTDRSNRS